MIPLLCLNHFSLEFVGRSKTSANRFHLNDLCFSIHAGETHALVGESGSGKSITALSILRLLDNITPVSTTGSILFNGIQINELEKNEIRKLRGNEIAMIFQEPMTSLNPVYTVGSQLIEPLMLHQGMSRQAAYKQAVELLDRTGIQDPDYRIASYPHQLSGGQRQRVMIAMVLACRPRLLIADEPTTALDITIQEQILDLIDDLQQELGMAVLLITHDLPMVRKRADSVSIMNRGCIVEQGATTEIFEHPQNAYTKKLLDAVPQGRRLPRSPSQPLITLRNVSCSFTLRKQWAGLIKPQKNIINALNNITLTLYQNHTLGVVGESGSGKSTLAMCLLNLCSFTGEVMYYNNQKDDPLTLSLLSQRKFRPYRKELQIVFQDPFSSLSPRMTVAEIVGEGLNVHNLGGTKKERQRLIEKALAAVELSPEMGQRFPHEFSGGQRQRIAIARALILRPKLLILDEPTSALDMTIQKQVLELLEKLQNQYQMTYLFITHDLRTVRTIADHLVVMQHGNIVEYGAAEEIFAHPQQRYTRKLFQAAFQ